MDKKAHKFQFTGIGLIFGTALGAVLCIVLSQPIFYAGIGTAIGLVWGACIDAYSSRKKG